MTLRTLPVLLFLLTACAGRSSEPAILPADPEGILLDAEPATLAFDALQDMTPSAAPAGTIVGGFMTTRLEALVAPAATVAEVNQALTDAGAAIVSMRAGFPAVTLVVPAMADAGAAATLADELAATDGFDLVTPSFVPYATAEAEGGSSLATQALGSSALNAIRMTAAKNAIGLLSEVSIPVLVPDAYGSGTPHEKLSAQVFLSGAGAAEAEPELGNGGFTACGIIGTDPSFAQFDAVHPDPLTSLELQSLLLGGLTWTERVIEITEHLPAGKFVLNTGFQYGVDFDERSMVWRAIDALAWRKFAANASGFVHLTAAGDCGPESGPASEAGWASPFGLSETFPSLATLVQTQPGIPRAEQAAFADALLALGGEPAPLGNLRIVGSSNATDHAPSSFSCSGEDLRVVGEDVLALCFAESSGCDGTATLLTSTYAATAQVSGLFAWLWSLAPERSAAELLELVDRAWFNGDTPGLVDAYYATLALDYSMFDPRVRRELLDVAAGSDAPSLLGNGMLDHHDLKVFVDAFEAGTNLRYDLNGDGQVGGDGRALFDLDVNHLPEIATVSEFVEGEELSFDESGVTDLEVLCYYAYSSLYAGDNEARATLLAECNGLPQGATFLDSFLVAGSATARLGDAEDGQAYDYTDTTEQTASAGANLGNGMVTGAATTQSYLLVDAYQNLVKVYASSGASGTLAVSGWDGEPVEGGGQQILDCRFTVAAGPVAGKLEVEVGGGVGGNDLSNSTAFLRVRLRKDGERLVEQVFDLLTSGPPPTVLLQDLELEDGEYRLDVSVEFLLSAGDTAEPGQSINAGGELYWELALNLYP